MNTMKTTTNTETNTTPATPEMQRDATPTSAAPSTPLTMLPQFATTPKRGTARKPKREASILLAYAIEHGGRVELTGTGKADLIARGLPEHRISCAVYDVRKYFGKPVIAERNGRAVSAYVVSL